MVRRHKPRHGVVLLVVLTLLTLLIVIGLTFAALSGHLRRAGEANALRERFGDDPKDLTDQAMYQLLRDTSRMSRSVLRGHSLLADLYGNDSALGVVSNASLSGEFLTIVVTPLTPFNTNANHYNGSVLSFLDPVARSTRVIRYTPTTNTLIVEWTEGALPVAGTRFVVNGLPFNGTGAGYSHTAPNYSLDESIVFIPANGIPRETALLPNYGQYEGLTDPNTGLICAPTAGGMDEDRDAVDFQDMFLAMNPPDATLGIIPSFHRPALVNYWLKRFGVEELGSLSTTDLITAFRDPYQLADIPTRQRLLQLKRSIILRPLPEDHPNFPNATQFNATMGQPDDTTGLLPANQRLELPQMVWDVDNDGDGIADSIWIDIGLPVQTDASGRRYRPLVAILCQDLDGRLNLNAHSSVAQWENIYAAGGVLQPLPSAADTPQPFATPTLPLAPINLPQLTQRLIPRGLGYGPAEIFLGHTMNNSDYRYLLESRYLFDGTTSLGRVAGIKDFDDPLSRIKSLGVPFDYRNELSAFGSPPDLWGNGGIGLDLSGQPISIYMGKLQETQDDPYEMVLNRDSAGFHDNYFTVAEQERLMRYHDLDAFGLPNRLVYNSTTNGPVLAFAGNSAAAEQNRRRVTTASSHISMPAAAMPKKLRSLFAAGTSYSLLDVYRARLAAYGVTGAAAETELQKIVPWEILHGERFDINRWLGNGRDDNANNVVDEPGEADAGEPVWPTGVGLPADYDSGTAPYTFNYLNDDPVITVNRFAPQIYARHLYCLMMLLADHYNNTDYYHPLLEDLSQTTSTLTDDQERRELTAQRIAQWAINVVDFRDSNAIMTPFEYDVNPFDGWMPMDGNVNTNENLSVVPPQLPQRRIVWGMEQPELVFSEITAAHDRRVRDTSLDSTGEQIDPMGADQTMDQYRIPQGSLIMELYATRNRINMNPMVPFELYNAAGQLDLARLAPPGGGRQVPVWRVAISEYHSSAPGEIESPLRRRTTKPESTTFQPYSANQPDSMSMLPVSAPDRLQIERIVWFAPVNPTAVGIPAAEAETIYWNRNAAANAQVPPASYLVVGPRAETRIGSQDPPAPVTPPIYLPSQQRITLLGNQVEYVTNTGVNRTPPLTYVKPARTIVAAANPPATWTDVTNTAPNGIGLNVTEPLPGASYYPEPTAELSTASGNPSERFPFDSYYSYDTMTGVLPNEPFDSQPGAPLADDGILETATTPDYKTAFLQRLANPLEPWHPTLNPYITVDWMPIDVTVFNGEDFPGAPDPDDPSGTPTPSFDSRERGGLELNMWSVNSASQRDHGCGGGKGLLQLQPGQFAGVLERNVQARGRGKPPGRFHAGRCRCGLAATTLSGSDGRLHR